MSAIGTFETCRRTLRMAADRGGPEVAGRPSKRRDDPKRTSGRRNYPGSGLLHFQSFTKLLH